MTTKDVSATASIDQAKALGDLRVREARRVALDAPHMDSLVQYVQDLRTSSSAEYQIPDFDPLDAGVNAKIFFVLEAAGPKATASGFVSRDNPDETAKKFRELLAIVGISRGNTVLWNIVPWYIGDGGRIRAARTAEIREGVPHLLKLIGLLPQIRAIVLVGRKAQRTSEMLAQARLDLTQYHMPHPSPMFVNRAPENRLRLAADLRVVAQCLVPRLQDQ
jgi:uracil-DNA glycosylase